MMFKQVWRGSGRGDEANSASGQQPTNAIEGADRLALEQAVHLLEEPGVAVQMANRLGKPIEVGLEHLPKGVSRRVHDATHAAIEKALDVAIRTMPAKESPHADDGPDDDAGPGWAKAERAAEARDQRIIDRAEINPGTGKRGAIRRGAAHWADRSAWLHRLGATTIGGLSGAFGIAALVAELPISTTLMLRSIAQIAREEGEDLSGVEARVACTEVFALGGRRGSDDAADTGYFAVRSTLARAVSRASEQLASQSLARTTTRHMPSVTRLIGAIANRFSTSVTEKLAAQSVPLIGAAGGATVNYVFMNHFQHVARGHFIVRRLERTYGKALVQAEYESMQSAMGDRPAR